MDPQPARLDDLERMRVVSHPARWRVLQELWSGRSLTSTDAASLVGLTPSAMSYHLRRLAKLGLVEQADSADGRERPWRASTDGMRMTGQPDAAVGGTMMQNLRTDLDRALSVPPPPEGDPRPWPAGFSHRGLRLTRAAAKELHTRIDALIEQARDADSAADSSTPDSPVTDSPATGSSATDSPAEVFDYEVFWVSAAVRTRPQTPASDSAEADAPTGT
ncbi:ArsR/SmtB family transcription factor [Brachybacterium sp. DNPG3]